MSGMLRMSLAEYLKRHGFKPQSLVVTADDWPRLPERREPRENKFGAIKGSDGDSRKEVKRLMELRLLQAAGKIQHLIPQVRYELVPAQRKGDGTVERAITYTCDAQYIEDGKLVVEDVKSEITRKLPAFIHKRKLMLQLFDIEVREI